jgi:hypothetical protein
LTIESDLEALRGQPRKRHRARAGGELRLDLRQAARNLKWARPPSPGFARFRPVFYGRSGERLKVGNRQMHVPIAFIRLYSALFAFLPGAREEQHSEY